jgi:hypothetical protein
MKKDEETFHSEMRKKYTNYPRTPRHHKGNAGLNDSLRAGFEKRLFNWRTANRSRISEEESAQIATYC